MSDIRKREGKKGSTWQLRFTDAQSGKLCYKTFPRRKDAEAFLGTLARSEYVHDSNTVSVAQATDRWLHVCEHTGRKGREPVEGSTIKQYRLHAGIITERIGGTKLNALTPTLCDRFRDELLESFTRKYAKKILTSFKSILSQARSDGYMRHNPSENTVILISKRYERSEPVTIPSLEEVRRLLATAHDFKTGSNIQMRRAWSRYYPFFLVLTYSGVRPGEAIGLPWSNVDFDAATLRVTQDATEDRRIGLPKSASAFRHIYMPDNVMAELRAWRLSCPDSKLDLVFPTWSGTVESHANFTNRGWYVLQRACGLTDNEGRPKYPLKSLRHVRASLEIHHGATPKEIQMLLGHSTVQITFDVYGHLFKDHEEERAARANIIADQLSRCGEFVA